MSLRHIAYAETRIVINIIPPLHIHHIGPFLPILAIWENTGRPGRRSGMTQEEAGRNGEIGQKTTTPPHHTGPYWKKTGRSGRSGSNMGDTGTTRELYGSNTAQSGITRGNTGDFSPSQTSPYCSNYPVLSPFYPVLFPCCSRIDRPMLFNTGVIREWFPVLLPRLLPCRSRSTPP